MERAPIELVEISVAGVRPPCEQARCGDYCGRPAPAPPGRGVLVLVRLVLDERVVLVVAVRRAGGLRVEAGGAVLEGETHLVQLRLDLVDGLGAEVADVEQVLLRAA